jgi:selenocysteine lyase/cysteine desulfurase
MNTMQKIALAAAIAGAFIIIMRKAMAYERALREKELPTLHPVDDAEPLQPEPLPHDDLRVAQNSPL